MKRLLIILTLFLFFINTSAFAAQNIAKKDYTVVTRDSFRIYAQLKYPNIKTQREFKTVILLHSLGYTSQWWETIPEELLGKGYAVLSVDLRGHGKSVYNSKLVRLSWKSLTNTGYAKYPDDVIDVMNWVRKENPKRVFFDNYALIGSDIGAAVSVLVANKYELKPKTIVMLSPVVAVKSLYIPVKLAELNNIDILSICGLNDVASINAQEYLAKFAQSSFVKYTSESKSSGMLMLKNDKTLTPFIVAWIEQYLK